MNTARIYTGIERDRDNAAINQQCISRGLDTIRDGLISNYGGLTEIPGNGKWQDDTGIIQSEKCLIFDVIGEIAITDIKDILYRANYYLNQNSYLVLIDNTPEFIKPAIYKHAKTA